MIIIQFLILSNFTNYFTWFFKQIIGSCFKFLRHFQLFFLKFDTNGSFWFKIESFESNEKHIEYLTERKVNSIK